jgi:prepilin-type processing-associated H-X9-DG protein
LFPAFARARDAARKSVCLSNLRQIGVAFAMYADDWDECFPNDGDPYLWMGRRWRWPLQPYLLLSAQRDPTAPSDPLRSVNNRPAVLICPSDTTAPGNWDSTSYGYCAAFYHTPDQVNHMTTDDLWKLDRFPCVTQGLDSVAQPSKKVLVAEWLTNHDRPAVGWWDWRGARNYLFVDGHVRYLPARRLLPAVNNFPDPNLTVDGLEGSDLP